MMVRYALVTRSHAVKKAQSISQEDTRPMPRTTIEWTDTTWNPVTGCTKVSQGCTHCYAETFSERFRNVPGHPFERGFDVVLRPERLDLPATWKAPRMVFVCSMSDLFHEDIPENFISRVFDTMQRTPRHTYQLLTKRAERLLALSPFLPWAPHIWMGVSVENAHYLHRIDALRRTGAHLRFVSIEPLLGPIPHLDLEGIDWVIAGGESGPKARPINPAWVQGIRDRCRQRGIPLFFKQWGRAKHNPDPHDPTIAKEHPFHAKGGCRLDGEVIWEKPMAPKDDNPTDGRHQLEGREGAGSHASPNTGRSREAPRTRQEGGDDRLHHRLWRS